MASPAKGQLKISDLSKSLASAFLPPWDLMKREAHLQAQSRARESRRPDPTNLCVCLSVCPQICLSLGRLLHHLAHSPLGSVTLLDFRPRQFVLVDGELKVTDLDDARVEETPCTSVEDCTLEFPARNFTLPCSAQGWCENMNEKRNLYNAYR